MHLDHLERRSDAHQPRRGVEAVHVDQGDTTRQAKLLLERFSAIVPELLEPCFRDLQVEARRRIRRPVRGVAPRCCACLLLPHEPNLIVVGPHAKWQLAHQCGVHSVEIEYFNPLLPSSLAGHGGHVQKRPYQASHAKTSPTDLVPIPFHFFSGVVFY